MEWWKDAIIYQIYPRSFQDSNGDGIGDIPGIISRLDHLQQLGVNALWLSPVYKSPNADNGYDISDYREINPEYGTMADMERLIAEAKRRGIRVIMDLVINHTSTEHYWFQKSRDKTSPYADYYYWQHGKADGSLPNNWTGFFGEDCWEFDPQRCEYYLHLFARTQADLNYHNPAVLEEVKDILRFWLRKGWPGSAAMSSIFYTRTPWRTAKSVSPSPAASTTYPWRAPTKSSASSGKSWMSTTP